MYHYYTTSNGLEGDRCEIPFYSLSDARSCAEQKIIWQEGTYRNFQRSTAPLKMYIGTMQPVYVLDAAFAVIATYYPRIEVAQ